MNDDKSQEKTAGNGVIVIRKYPNRRFYNTRSSSHVTLQEICELVREGNDIRVEDSKSGADITVMVLTQILLEIESPKLVFFPSSLLQHLIRLNSTFLESVSENYFHQALTSFQRAKDQWSGPEVPGWSPPFATGADEWSKAWSKVFEGAFSSKKRPAAADGQSETADPENDPATVDHLRRELEELKERLGRVEKSAD